MPGHRWPGTKLSGLPALPWTSWSIIWRPWTIVTVSLKPWWSLVIVVVRYVGCRCPFQCWQVCFLILPGIPVSREQGVRLLTQHMVSDGFLETTDETIHKEFWWEVSSASFHRCHQLGMSIYPIAPCSRILLHPSDEMMKVDSDIMWSTKVMGCLCTSIFRVHLIKSKVTGLYFLNQLVPKWYQLQEGLVF